MDVLSPRIHTRGMGVVRARRAMNLIADDVPAFLRSRLSWDASPPAIISGSESWLRATLHLAGNVLDERGHPFPLRGELWVTVYPPRADGTWRAEAEEVGATVVGRGRTSEDALRDWHKRFGMTVQ